jgi:indole-3-glycerol phosphate synthase
VPNASASTQASVVLPVDSAPRRRTRKTRPLTAGSLPDRAVVEVSTIRAVTASRRLSQAISEGDGISILVEVRDRDDARVASDEGADGLVLRGLLEDVRDVSPLPLLVYGPSLRDAADATADAVVVRADAEPEQLVELVDLAASLGLECVVRVRDEDDLELVLEHVDPEILLLCAEEADDDETPLDRLLALLPDVPAGKLAIAELAGATRVEVEELERAGVDAVLVAGDAAQLVGESLPDV